MLVLHCFIIPFSGIIWLICNRYHILSYQSSDHLGEDDIVQLPSVHVEKVPGTILSFKFLFEHFNSGSFFLRIFGYFSELILRCAVAAVTIYYDEDHWGLVYASCIVLLHMLFVAVVRPYNRGDVYTASSLSDTCTILVLLSLSLYKEGLMKAERMDFILYNTTVVCVMTSFVLHIWRQ